MYKEKTILAGITQDNELYFINVTEENHNGDFSMTGETVRPIKEEDAKTQVYDSLSDGEFWRQAVQDERTELGKDAWINQVLANDGELAGFDNSLFPEEVEVNGDKYLFESGSCGQHTENDLKNYFIDESQYKALMTLWKLHHLKKSPKASHARSVLERALAIEQDIPNLAEQAVRIILNEENI